jgi:hypothetical protein
VSTFRDATPSRALLEAAPAPALRYRRLRVAAGLDGAGLSIIGRMQYGSSGRRLAGRSAER